MKTVHRAGALGLLCAALHAQSYAVSPASATSAEANSSSLIPWSSPTMRYQQVHNDTRGRAMLVQGLSFRRDQGGYGLLRTIDAEAFMGYADYATATGSFLGNYTGQRQAVINRKQMNLPDLTASQGTPEPFLFVVPFDLPFPYIGTQDLAWEFVVYSTIGTGNYVLDAHAGRVSATTRWLGSGCTVKGRVSAMILGTTSDATVDVMRFGWTTASCPNNALSLVVVGVTSPNLTVPGLCTNVYVMPLVVFPGIAVGEFFTIPISTIPFDPSLSGATFYSQTFSQDPAQSGVPLSGSQGVQSTIGYPAPFRIARIWATNVNAASGSQELMSGLVVRFTH